MVQEERTRTSGRSCGKSCAIKVKWTIGHGTQDHINEGVTTKQEAANNERADHAADEGRLQHKVGLRAVVPHYEEVRTDQEELLSALRIYMLLNIKTRMDIFGRGECRGGPDKENPARRRSRSGDCHHHVKDEQRVSHES